MKLSLFAAVTLSWISHSQAEPSLSASLEKPSSNSLLEKIQSRLKAYSAPPTQCSANELCSSGTPPYANFSSAGGAVIAQADSCCPGSFVQCEIELNQQMCRDLVYYTINPDSQDSIQVCPQTSTNCACQQVFHVDSTLNLYLCPTPSDCCPNCECHGDPHCTSFSKGSQSWAICDDRGPSCVHEESTCIQTMYDGQYCQWSTKFGGYCGAAPGTQVATMVMYEKTYKSYFNPNDNTQYQFSMVLALGVYGAISQINITDAGTLYSFSLTSSNCLPDPQYPLNSQGESVINNLPSGVNIVLRCNTGYGHSPTALRWDVVSLEDPWFVPQPAGETFGGFCSTGVISENNTKNNGCSIADSQVAQYLQCKGDLDACMSQWCDAHASQLQFGSSPQTLVQAKASCNQFLLATIPTTNNFLLAVCALAPNVANGKFPVDPSQCLNNQACRECVDNVMDYMIDIAEIINTGSIYTPAPTVPCPGDLLSIGLSHNILPQGASGIQIEYQAPGKTTWTPVFALLDVELESCGGCHNPIALNGSQPQNLALMIPGTYRIRQCHGFDNSPTQDLCTAVPQYNVSVAYSNPYNGAYVSSPYGQLFNEGQLTCSQTLYSECPVDFTCCVWTQQVMFDTCMMSSYGTNWKTQYPNCKPKTSS